ncbi:MAG: TetR/AcrR family transcriptional regulator [Acidimicrobiales bacterium]
MIVREIAPGENRETRSRIAEVALRLIADHGYAATSTREIAARLGFTKAALYYHFRTKDDLLAAIVEPVVADLASLVGGGEPQRSPSARRRAVGGYVDLVVAHADLVRVLANDPAVRGCPALTAAFPLYRRLSQFLAGTESLDAVQRTRVRAALGAVHAAILRAGPDEDRDQVRAATLAAACGALGIAPPHPAA